MGASNKWTADNITEVATPKISVITKISKWDNYEYVEMDSLKLIKGSNEDKSKNSELFEFQMVDNINVLVDLLVLNNQIPIKDNQNITEDDKKHIIKFCKRWGLPRWGCYHTNNYCINGKNKEVDIAESTMLRDVVPFSHENYMHIPSFITALRYLKLDFLHIVATHNLENDANISPLLLDGDIRQIHGIRKRTISTSHIFLPSLNPFVTYWNYKRKGLFLNCENLIHLSVYYLCAIHQTGKCFGGYIKICKSCGNPFVTTNANRKYCGTPDIYGCTRQAYCNKKTRQKKKALLP
ncbi:hypothetical protein IMSAG185_01487 [Lachnospiraceae bacterium]|nr:hypothetical protein IMSAG185_01487 [Lachnospiraceae bacterium]